MNNLKSKETIAQEFRNIGEGSVRFLSSRPEVLSHISSIRLNDLEKIEEFINSIRPLKTDVGGDYAHGHTNAVDKILQYIEKQKKIIN